MQVTDLILRPVVKLLLREQTALERVARPSGRVRARKVHEEVLAGLSRLVARGVVVKSPRPCLDKVFLELFLIFLLERRRVFGPGRLRERRGNGRNHGRLGLRFLTRRGPGDRRCQEENGPHGLGLSWGQRDEEGYWYQKATLAQSSARSLAWPCSIA